MKLPDLDGGDARPAGTVRSSKDTASARKEFSVFERGLDLDSYAVFRVWEDRWIADGFLLIEPSDYFIEQIHNFLAKSNIDRLEVTGVVPRLLTPMRESIRDRAKAMDGTRMRKPRITPEDGGKYDAARARKLLSPSIPNLRGTVLCEVVGKDVGSFDPRIGARLELFTIPAIRTFANIALAVHSSLFTASDLTHVIADLERYEDLFLETGEDPMDPAAVSRVLNAYAIERTLFAEDGHGVVRSVVQRRFSSDAQVRNFFAQHTELADAIAAASLPLPSDAAEFGPAFRKLLNDQKSKSQQVRKDKSDPLANEFDIKLAALRVRYKQSGRMARHSRRAAAKLLAGERPPRTRNGIGPQEGPLEFSYRERVVRPDGRRLVATQRVYMRAYRASHFDNSLSDDEVVFEFVGVEPDGVACHEPWFVEMFRVGLFLNPREIEIEVRERRRDLMVENAFPGLLYKPAFMSFRDKKKDVATAALVEHGMILIPIAEFALAMAFAHLIVRIMAMTLCRIGEVQQMIYDSHGWTTVSSEGRKYAAFWAIPKDWWERSAYALDDRTMKYLRVFTILSKMAAPDGLLPESKPCQSLALKVQPSRFVFAFGGRQCAGYEINFILACLLCGLGIQQSHDIRHAASNRMLVANHPVRQIALAMRHRGDSYELAAEYSRLTENQKETQVFEFMAEVGDQEDFGTAALCLLHST